MKTYTVKSCKYGDNSSPVLHTGTLPYLIKEVFGYTLECGASYEREEGNKKINLNPKTGKSLVLNLNNAANNRALNGCSNRYYELV